MRGNAVFPVSPHITLCPNVPGLPPPLSLPPIHALGDSLTPKVGGRSKIQVQYKKSMQMKYCGVI